MDKPTLSPRQAAFRADFRTRIAPAYSGWAHVALIFALGAAAIWYCARQIAHPAWYDFLVIPVAFCISNVFEWWIHRYVMHRPVKGLMGIYSRHTLNHHQFFTDVEPSFDTSRDFRIVFFCRCRWSGGPPTSRNSTLRCGGGLGYPLMMPPSRMIWRHYGW
jgi:hypothetical protein